jgi:TonB-dependent SusC/RagA subfamily outer membrane receptor
MMRTPVGMLVLGALVCACTPQRITAQKDGALGNRVLPAVATLAVVPEPAPSAPPTAGTRIIIGEGSATSSGTPALLVVDGKVQPTWLPGQPAPAGLSPEMIERIELLKGPAAVPLFGAAGANGAILVWTRKAAPPAPKR